MIVTSEALKSLESHWAVKAVQSKDRIRASNAAQHRHVQTNLGRQLTLDFEEKVTDEAKIQKLAMAYELAASEGMRAMLMPTPQNEESQQQAMAGAFKAFELRRTLSVPTDAVQRVFHVLHLGALANCGDRGSDFKRWLTETPEAMASLPMANAEWDLRVTYHLFECWMLLWRKEKWQDLDGVRSVILRLRNDQLQHEKVFLDSSDEAQAQANALRLIALYHWARATELLAVYLLQGESNGRIDADLDQHFEAAVETAFAARDPMLDVLLRWLHLAARRMAGNSIWRVAEKVNSRVKDFVKRLTEKSSHPLFELLPPQRAALREQGLLDSAHAIVVDLPTSAGKTLLAEFRIIQALDQFRDQQGWVAYVAPTRALTAQLTRRLRADLQPLGIRVEQLTAATEIDSVEEGMLLKQGSKAEFDVLVATPEKLSLVIRNSKVPRPLTLLVLDEAHNLEDEERGLRIELLLATVKTDCPTARFLLLMPNVPNGDELARWLGAEDSKSISLSTAPWQPNDRLVGEYWVEPDEEDSSGWQLKFETLTTTHRALHLQGVHNVGPVRPLPKLSFSKASKSLTAQTAAMAKVFSERSEGSTSIAIAGRQDWAWGMARTLKENMPQLASLSPEIKLVQRFLQAEISPKFELIELLAHGIGVHHAGLSDECRGLIEHLAERGELKVLCATTTIAQGINFPVSSIFAQDIALLQSKHPRRREMSARDFWNLAGRAGRVQHDSIGVVGIAAGENHERNTRFVSAATGELVSRLLKLLNDVETAGNLQDLSAVIQGEQWADFRSYIAHLVNEKQRLDEAILRNTFGFTSLKGDGTPASDRKVKQLLDVTKAYADKVAKDKGRASLVDQTGFSFESVGQAFVAMNDLPRKLTPSDWEPKSLFGSGKSSMLPQLVGVLMRVPEIQQKMSELSSGGLEQKQIAKLAQAWVSGESLEQIAKDFFAGKNDDVTEQVTKACKAIYRNLATFGSWGLSALTKLGPSGLDFDKLSEAEKRQINLIPAMLYHGVQTEGAVLMRMSSVPRSIAESLGRSFCKEVSEQERSAHVARDFIRTLSVKDWSKHAPKKSALSGEDYRSIWSTLSGESE